ncbi:MAG: hypothetical protein ABI707_11145 [Ferruginibacter sp.]
MGNGNLLFESIFKRKISDADTRDYLIQITNDHPYFSPAQFFLLLLTEKDTPVYQDQAAKTSVLFNNPYWLQFKLEEEQQTASVTIEPNLAEEDIFVTTENQASVSPELTTPNETSDKSEATNADYPENEIIAENPVFVTHESLPSQPEETASEIIEGTQINPIIDETVILPSLENTEAPLPQNSIETATGENIIAEPGIDVDEPLTEEEILQLPNETPGLSVPENIAAPATGEYNIIPDQGNNGEQPVAEEEVSPLINETPGLPEPEKEETITKQQTDLVDHDSAGLHMPENKDEMSPGMHSGHFNSEDSPLVNETEAEDGNSREPEIEPLNFKLNIDTTNTTEENITFEPLHTSDYFASIGVKLSGELNPSDKLGKQLKSFTEWLKTMKKIHNDQLSPLSGQADMSIQKLAEESNKPDAVVTEAMADVLLLQGKAEKAIEVYKKLSLLNPSKSAYFAGKIDQLKEH